MNDFVAFASGILIGIAVAAPVGPIALLCMRETLRGGLPLGLATGLGAALADLFYATIAAFGIVAIANYIMAHQQVFRGLAGVILLAMAVHAWRSRPQPPKKAPEIHHHLGALLTGFVLTASNPLTLIGIFGVIAAVGIGASLTRWDLSASLALGVMAGSMLWWSGLCVITARIRHRFSDRALHRMNQITALVLAGFAAYALYTVFSGPLLVGRAP